MKIIEPSFQLIDPFNAMPPGKKIELVGRVCYKSESAITQDSHKAFVQRLIQNGHTAMLEHARIAFITDDRAAAILRKVCLCFQEHLGAPCFVQINKHPVHKIIHLVSANVRAWRDLFSFAQAFGCSLPGGIGDMARKYPDLFSDFSFPPQKEGLGIMLIKNPCATPSVKKSPAYWPIAAHHVPLTVKFTVDIAVARELCRHRLASHAGSSTRYCDYSGGKFGCETTVIAPQSSVDESFLRAAKYAEDKYMAQRAAGVPPQIARSCLTLSTMCEHIVTATLSQWKHIFALRALDQTGKAHPQMKSVMLPLYQQCQSLFPDVFKEA